MKIIQKTLPTVLFIVLSHFFVSAQPYTPINVASDSVAIGDTLCVPVTVGNFIEILGFQYSHTWNPEVLSFTGIKASQVSPDFFSPVPGKLVVLWSALTIYDDLTLPDGETLYYLCFMAGGKVDTAIVMTNGSVNPPASPAAIENYDGDNFFSASVNIPGIITVYSSISGAYTAASASTTPPFPNPFTNELHIKTPESEGLSFILCDITGHEIQHTPIRAGNNTMSTSALPEGIYVWQIRQDGQVIQAGKVVKTRE